MLPRFLARRQMSLILQLCTFSNTDAAKIFSLYSVLWSNEQNKLTIEHIKAKLQIKLNFDQDCKGFDSFVKSNKNLLCVAKSEKKYSSINNNNNNN